MKIAEIRMEIEGLSWNIRDFHGCTKDEFKRADVPGRLLPLIVKVEAITIAPRFKRDIERRADVVKYAHQMIRRWLDRRAEDTEAK